MGAFKNIWIKIMGDTSDVDAKMQQTERKGEELDKKNEMAKIKLAALWSYGNQITTMLLQGAAKAAEGTSRSAQIQSVIAGLQIAQSEFAIIQTLLQAKAAIASGNFIGAGLQYSVVGLMQINLISQFSNQIKAKEAESRANEISQLMESYK